jgi:hypothetical protein
MKRILIVGDPDTRDFVNQAYGDLAQVAFASSVTDAEALIVDNRPSIVIGTLAFDESRFLNLLPLLMELEIKTVVVDCPYTVMNDATLEVIKYYAKEMRVAAWWDMQRTLAKEGIEVAGKEIRAIVQSLLNDRLPSEPPPHGEADMARHQ